MNCRHSSRHRLECPHLWQHPPPSGIRPSEGTLFGGLARWEHRHAHTLLKRWLLIRMASGGYTAFLLRLGPAETQTSNLLALQEVGKKE
jgi:hypothetical protein